MRTEFVCFFLALCKPLFVYVLTRDWPYSYCPVVALDINYRAQLVIRFVLLHVSPRSQPYSLMLQDSGRLLAVVKIRLG